MRIRFALLIAGTMAFGMLTPGFAAADEAKDNTPDAAAQSAASAKAALANGLITVGRSSKDPLMMTAGVKLLSELEAPVMDPSSTANGGTPKNYDVSALVTEAKGYPGTDKTIMDTLASIQAPVKTRSYCAWAYQCNYYACAYYWVCGY